MPTFEEAIGMGQMPEGNTGTAKAKKKWWDFGSDNKYGNLATGGNKKGGAYADASKALEEEDNK